MHVVECLIVDSGKSSALLNIQTAESQVRKFAVSGDIQGLGSCLVQMLNKDVNTACRMLEIIPRVWGAQHRAKLCVLYSDVCIRTSACEVRAQALSNLASLMEDVLKRREYADLPSADNLHQLWASLETGEINPALSCAIINISGSFMVALTCPNMGDIPNLDQRIRGWGAMISDSLDVDNVGIPLDPPNTNWKANLHRHLDFRYEICSRHSPQDLLCGSRRPDLGRKIPTRSLRALRRAYR